MLSQVNMISLIRKIINPMGIDIVRYTGDRTRVIPRDKNVSLRPRHIVLGGGDRWYGSDWCNVEYITPGFSEKYKNFEKNIDMSHDLTSMTYLPIEENSVFAIYTSHVIEHLKDKHVSFIFSEAYRSLEPGGILRISCPDADLYTRAFLENDLDFFHYRNHEHYVALGINNSVSGLFLDVFATALGEKKESYVWQDIHSKLIELGVEHTLDYFCNQVEYDYTKSHYHINWFNKNKIFKLLQEVGFTDIYTSAVGQSYYPKMRDLNLFDLGDPKISLFIECRK